MRSSCLWCTESALVFEHAGIIANAMKLFIALSSWLLVLMGTVLMAAPVEWFPPFYDARYTGIALLLGALVIQLIPRFFRVVKDYKKNGAVDEFQFLITLFIIGNAAGELGFFHIFQDSFQYDKLLHFSTSFASVWRMPSLLERRYGLEPIRAVIFTLAGILVSGALWEVYEFGVDAVWHTRLHGVFGSDVRPDTIADIALNSLGALAGAAASLYKAKQISPMELTRQH